MTKKKISAFSALLTAIFSVDLRKQSYISTCIQHLLNTYCFLSAESVHPPHRMLQYKETDGHQYMKITEMIYILFITILERIRLL